MNDQAFTIFDASINRLLGVYATEDQALDVVSALLSVNSDDYADDLVVDCASADGVAGPLTGDRLRAWVRARQDRGDHPSSSSGSDGFRKSLASMTAPVARG